MARNGVWQVEAHEIDQLTTMLGSPQLIDDRFRRQQKDDGKLFAAWEGDEPAGMVFLWWREAEEPEIRDNLPDVALLMNLEVLPRLRNKGIGRKLIEKVEAELIERGEDQVALAVRTDNEGAIRLYRRLDFAMWGHSDVTCYAKISEEDGSVTLQEERCHVMVKNLPGQVRSTPSADEKQAGRLRDRFGVRWAHRMATICYSQVTRRVTLVKRDRGDAAREELQHITPEKAA